MSSVINETLLAIKSAFEAGVNIFNGGSAVSSSNPLPVGGKSLTSTCIFTRPADTTAYAAQLLVASGVTLNGTLAFSAQHQTKTVIPIGSGVFDVIG